MTSPEETMTDNVQDVEEIDKAFSGGILSPQLTCKYSLILGVRVWKTCSSYWKSGLIFMFVVKPADPKN